MSDAFLLAGVLWSGALAPTGESYSKAGDWPAYGGSSDRNTASDEMGIPATWDVGLRENIRWIAPLGTATYGSPVIAGGRIFVSTNNGGKHARAFSLGMPPARRVLYCGALGIAAVGWSASAGRASL